MERETHAHLFHQARRAKNDPCLSERLRESRLERESRREKAFRQSRNRLGPWV